MQEDRKEKLKRIIFGLVSISFIITFYLSFQHHKEYKRHWKTFINNAYFSIEHSLNRMDYLIENPESKRLEENIHSLERDLLEADVLIRSANHYFDNDIYYPFLFREAQYFLYGIKMSGTINVEVAPLAEDGKLDEKEITLLKTIRGYLYEAKQAMYSEDTKQENPDLTLDEFNEIVKDYLNNNTYQIYREAFWESRED